MLSLKYTFLLLIVFGTVIAGSGYRDLKYMCDKLNATDRICVIREYDPDDSVIFHISLDFLVDIDEVQINGMKDKLKMLFLFDNRLEEFIVSDLTVQLKNVSKIELQRNKILFLDSSDINTKFPNLLSLTICRSDIDALSNEMRQTLQSIIFSEINC